MPQGSRCEHPGRGTHGAGTCSGAADLYWLAYTDSEGRGTFENYNSHAPKGLRGGCAAVAGGVPASHARRLRNLVHFDATDSSSGRGAIKKLVDHFLDPLL